VLVPVLVSGLASVLVLVLVLVSGLASASVLVLVLERARGLVLERARLLASGSEPAFWKACQGLLRCVCRLMR
jgi:hypothetical protein